MAPKIRTAVAMRSLRPQQPENRSSQKELISIYAKSIEQRNARLVANI
jgi:hypothetical protein